ncbi:MULTISPECIES: LLM class flavin-dependent oxidoreductase [Rhodococcus]|uniref:Luciferase-like monooxygenase n=1 Tax=Rhodococcus opacus RKJ300 = JCM 13270 TaxID=1165867 RepID=I0WTR5_RHOOP|nr:MULTISPECIES: LLM class flavin-dependent oxidoreductase [Rhodococcus]EID79781.1 luciferase-like monooxygenase [Rhodococcus opacus RKJ300 = JCM 13270]KAF0961820.1 Pyrimidine monooxygenase RutA [Rhodococcus sp. T7]UOT08194.1 LLM class flavin-dependent oxidoreductase [Rhodococcus opacus]
MIAPRRLSPDDWRVWRVLRLAALRESPHAFESRLADWQGDCDTEGRWRGRLRDVEANFAVDVDGEPAGMVSGALIDGGTAVELISLWVTPHARGRGVGDLLVRTVLDWAVAGTTAERVVLRVHEGNAHARDLYERNGFRTLGAPTPNAEREMVHQLPQRVRVGIHSGQQYPDFASVQALWHSAERLGYDWVSLFDHYRPPIFGPDGPCFDGPTLLAALAATTSRVRCGLLVAPPVWRHPALTATIAATVDQVSGGRLEFGMGVGGADLAFEQYGIPQPTLGARYEQLDETCRILRLLWEGGPADFTGTHYKLRGAYLNPRPVQQRLPLVIGGAGECRTLQLVARHADIWNCAALAPETYMRKVDVLDHLCAQEGRKPAEVRRSVTFRCVITSNQAEAVRAHAAIERNANGHGPDLPEYVSFGSAEECLDRLAPYTESGVRDFLLGVRPPVDRGTVERFATEVAPALRGMA